MVLEEGEVVAGKLDAQHDPAFVIHLDRAFPEPVFDAGALDPGGELRSDLLGEQWRDGSAEEGSDLLGFTLRAC
jgi:hypothetical protein